MKPIKLETDDFTVCNDSDWNYTNDRIKLLTDKRKQREEFLKSLTDTITIVNDQTGEMETIGPPLKKQVMGLKVTLK